MQKEQFRHRHRLWDRLGISASALCLVHCVSLVLCLYLVHCACLV